MAFVLRGRTVAVLFHNIINAAPGKLLKMSFQGNGFFTGGVHTQPPFSRLQRVDGRLKRLVESAEVDAVEEAVIHLYRHPQSLAACAVRDDFPQTMRGMLSSRSKSRSLVRAVRSNQGVQEK